MRNKVKSSGKETERDLKKKLRILRETEEARGEGIRVSSSTCVHGASDD